MAKLDNYGLRAAARQLDLLADEFERGDFTDRRYVPGFVLGVLQNVVRPYGFERFLFRFLRVYLRDLKRGQAR